MKIVLSMIVKDEADVIERCLRSVVRFIDHAVIVDTGSTDNTKAIIEGVMRAHGVPLELFDRPWTNFGQNRTEALHLAQGANADYILLIDADEELQLAGPMYQMARMIDNTTDLYHFKCRYADHTVEWARPGLIRASKPWYYSGALHEYLALVGDPGLTTKTLDIPLLVHRDGARGKGISQQEKYARDAAILKAEVDRDPTNSRNVFYLAQSYRDAGQLGPAWDWYRRRSEMGGWAEEVWYSLYQMARIYERMGADNNGAVRSYYLDAYNFRPSRCEPLVDLARYCRLREEYALAAMFASAACRIPVGSDLLFVDRSYTDWRARDEFAIASYYTGNYASSAKVCDFLLEHCDLPADQVKRVQENHAFALSKLD